MIHAGSYVYDGTPGTYERGNAERARQDRMVQEAGGMLDYLRGAWPRDNRLLTAAGRCGIMQGPRDKLGTPDKAV